MRVDNTNSIRVSRFMSVSVLAHNQALGTPASTRVTADVAEELVRRLICERITRKLIRMLAPESVFRAPRADVPAAIADFVPEKLPPREVSGCVFRGPRCVKPHSVFFRHPAREPRAAASPDAQVLETENHGAISVAS
jgi:hypothetical protein